MIIIYGAPGCALCAAAKEKLELMGLEYEERDITQYLEAHDGWEDDESADVMAAYTLNGNLYPILQVDGKFVNYPQAMRLLKGR